MSAKLETCQHGAELIARSVTSFVENASANPEILADLIDGTAGDCETLAKQLRLAARDVRIAGRVKASQEGE